MNKTINIEGIEFEECTHGEWRDASPSAALYRPGKSAKYLREVKEYCSKCGQEVKNE